MSSRQTTRKYFISITTANEISTLRAKGLPLQSLLEHVRLYPEDYPKVVNMIYAGDTKLSNPHNHIILSDLLDPTSRIHIYTK